MELIKVIPVEDSQFKIIRTNINVQAGFPSPALDYTEEPIDLNELLIRHPLATFMTKCENDSMIGACIPPGAVLVVDKSLTPKNKDIVVAVVNGEFTLKFFKKTFNKGFLVPANQNYAAIEITEDMQMQIWGVVTSVIIDTKDLKQCMP